MHSSPGHRWPPGLPVHKTAGLAAAQRVLDLARRREPASTGRGGWAPSLSTNLQRKHPLPHPFFVLATQNPIEQEGTYPLPEAQLDRFMFQINMDYPTAEEELEVILSSAEEQQPQLREVMEKDELVELANVVKQIPVARHVAQYALEIIRQTRPQNGGVLDEVRRFVTWGSGPRGGQNLVMAARAFAALHGRFAVEIDDIQAVCGPVLAHRIKTNFSADAEGVTPQSIIEMVVKEVSSNSGFKFNGLVPELLGS